MTGSQMLGALTTRDFLFMAFGGAFLIEGANRVAFLFLDRPNEGDRFLYVIRVLSYVLILAGIIHKNRS
jgi:hypothetical protein